ncbi:MAG: hypothetical protein M3Q58_02860 [Bacteroidota bacterium]|nr:hypothetical protein [Bacteroidota bacterium]
MFRNTHSTILVFSSILFSLFLLSSCDEKKAEEQPDSETIDITDDITDEENITYILPSPLQIASIFKRSGMEYVSGISNPTANAEKYTGIFSKSLAMGIYSADLAYGIVNNQTQEAMNNLKTIKNISGDLGLASVFDTESLLTRFENNLGNEDSLAYIVSDLQMDMDVYLEENQKEHLAVLIFTGAWIESMYLGSKTVEKADNKKLSNRIGEQFIILDNLIKALKSKNKANESIPLLITELEHIKTLFDSVTNETEDQSSFNIKEQDLNLLSIKIQELRLKITEGNL